MSCVYRHRKRGFVVTMAPIKGQPDRVRVTKHTTNRRRVNPGPRQWTINVVSFERLYQRYEMS